MSLFILLNGGDLSKLQWTDHPFDERKTLFLDRLREKGTVYTYNPVFCNYRKFDESTKGGYDDDFRFRIEDLDLGNHCKFIHDNISEIDYENIIIISHSRGHMIALKYLALYPENVTGYINIDGGYTDEWYKKWLAPDKVNELRAYTDDDLNGIFDALESGNDSGDGGDGKDDKDVKKNVRLLGQIVKYHMYRQYDSINYDHKCKVIIFNSLDAIDYDMEYVKDKLRYNNDAVLKNDSVKSVHYFDATHFVYFDKTDDIMAAISKM